jgi:hypothetical protein
MTIKCNGETSDPKIYSLTKKDAETKINEIIYGLPHNLHGYSQFVNELPRNFQAEIEPIGFKPLNISFLLDEKSILKVLVELNIYERREDAIRELKKIVSIHISLEGRK